MPFIGRLLSTNAFVKTIEALIRRVKLRLHRALLLAGWAAAAFGENNNLQRALPGAGLLAETVQAEARKKIKITGQHAISEQEIRAAQAEEIRDIAEKGMTPARADDLAFYIASFYRKAGYSKVAVDYEIRGGKVLIKINEGPALRPPQAQLHRQSRRG